MADVSEGEGSAYDPQEDHDQDMYDEDEELFFTDEEDIPANFQEAEVPQYLAELNNDENLDYLNAQPDQAHGVEDERVDIDIEEQDVYLRVDRSPTPIQTVVNGKHLQRLLDAEIHAPKPRASNAKVIKRIADRDFLEHKPLRSLRYRWSEISRTLKVAEEGESIEKGRTFEFKTYEPEETNAVIPVLVRLLERFPCNPRELSSKWNQWVCNLARKLARLEDETIRPHFPLPRLLPPRANASSTVPFYEVKMYGLDSEAPAGQRFWTSRHAVKVGDVAKINQDDVPADFVWEESRDREVEVKEEDREKALLMAKLITVTFCPYFGPRVDCERAIREFRKSYYSKKYDPYGGRARASKSFEDGPCDGKRAWVGPWKRLHLPWTYIQASVPMKQRSAVKLPYLTLRTTDKLQWIPVLHAILEVLYLMGDSYEAWKAGTIACDAINEQLQSGDLEDVRFHCDELDKDDHFHPCAMCFLAVQCQQLEWFEEDKLYFCEKCTERIDAGQPAVQTFPTTQADCAAALKRRLKFLLELDARASNEKLDGPELESQATTILSELLEQQVVVDGQPQPGEYHDALVNQILSENAPTVNVWSGQAKRPNLPSIDAIDPFHAVTKNGKRLLAYHAAGNCQLISLSLNYMAKSRPKASFLGIAQTIDPMDEEDEQNGIAVLRNVHLLHYEAGLGRRNRAYRFGQPVPEDYEEFKQLYRTGARVSVQHVPLDIVYRTVPQRQDAKVIRDTWKHPTEERMMQGVENILKVRHGLDGPKQEYWMRFEKVGNRTIPFFFNHKYSIVKRWTIYDFINFSAQRLWRMRNVCDITGRRKYAKNPDLRPAFELDTFIYVHAQLWGQLINENLVKFKHQPWRAPGADSWGIPIFPTINMITSVSFGHKHQGGHMRSGYSKANPTSHGEEDWKHEDCGIACETQGKNCAIFDLPLSVTDELKAQLFNIRAMSNEQLAKPLLPPGRVRLAAPVLRDELSVEIVPADEATQLIGDDEDIPLGDIADEQPLDAASDSDEEPVVRPGRKSRSRGPKGKGKARAAAPSPSSSNDTIILPGRKTTAKRAKAKPQATAAPTLPQSRKSNPLERIRSGVQQRTTSAASMRLGMRSPGFQSRLPSIAVSPAGDIDSTSRAVFNSIWPGAQSPKSPLTSRSTNLLAPPSIASPGVFSQSESRYSKDDVASMLRDVARGKVPGVDATLAHSMLNDEVSLFNIPNARTLPADITPSVSKWTPAQIDSLSLETGRPIQHWTVRDEDDNLWKEVLVTTGEPRKYVIILLDEFGVIEDVEDNAQDAIDQGVFYDIDRRPIDLNLSIDRVLKVGAGHRKRARSQGDSPSSEGRSSKKIALDLKTRGDAAASTSRSRFGPDDVVGDSQSEPRSQPDDVVGDSPPGSRFGPDDVIKDSQSESSSLPGTPAPQSANRPVTHPQRRHEFDAAARTAAQAAAVSSRMPFPCLLVRTHGCNLRFSSIKDAIDHKMKTHDTEAPFFCPTTAKDNFRGSKHDCTEMFDSREEAEEHASVHNQRKLDCTMENNCSKDFDTDAELAIHLEKHKTKGQYLRCPFHPPPDKYFEDYSFVDCFSFFRHMLNSHSAPSRVKDVAYLSDKRPVGQTWEYYVHFNARPNERQAAPPRWYDCNKIAEYVIGYELVNCVDPEAGDDPMSID